MIFVKINKNFRKWLLLLLMNIEYIKKTGGWLIFLPQKYFQSESRCASVPIRGEWVTFLIRKSLTGRSGWRIMTENENMNLRVNRETIEMVTEKIRSVSVSMNNHNRYRYSYARNRMQSKTLKLFWK